MDRQEKLNFYNEELVSLIIKKLTESKDQIKKDFANSSSKIGTRFACIDNLLPSDLAQKIFDNFPQKNSAWREMSSFRERKLTSKAFDKVPKILGEITYAIQHADVIKEIQEITGMISLEADPTMYAGGLSMMRSGDFLNPHIDNSHDQDRKLYRRLNLLYYVTPDWRKENGGHLELWDTKVIS